MKQKPAAAAPSRLLTTMISHAVPDYREPSPARNEGHLIDVTHRRSGNDVVEVGFDISSAPVPPRHYVAEVCFVDVNDGHLRLVFGQRALGIGEELESAIVIRLSPHAAHNFVDLIFGMTHPGLEAIAATMNIAPTPLLSSITRPVHVAHLAANMAAVGVSGYESCLDFYQTSPFAMKHIEKKKQIGVEPVVRVNLSTGLLLSLASEAKSLVANFPPRLFIGGQDARL